MDFNELNPMSPILLVVESLNSKKTLPMDTLPTTLRNMGEYLCSIPTEAGIADTTWKTACERIEVLFKRLVLILNNLDSPDYLLNTIVAILKLPALQKVTFVMNTSSELSLKLNVTYCSFSEYFGSILQSDQSLCSTFNATIQSVE